ncbi:ankyrin repeat-containing protein at3g12360 [Phtheirospermum japonicum]|uniref:Ankyrin repeat-containing protein at3g12360 n=1 Tax=Phtheirospermum japonicum TaxID=374723 RepID=A0A830BX68_9LAMI|nr:ankyrin repeat-containing protein at3g12360 [Phtheirospermum japonicum]
MEKSLSEAAKNGDVEKLHNLIKVDPFLLRAANLADGDNPLHTSCMGGHVDFVKQVLNLRPDFAQELNRDGFSPLHIASASGDIEIVKELLRLGGFVCLVKGKEKRVPLHCAVVKGRIKVISELLSVCSDSVKEVTARGESCLHLAVKNNQFEAFKALCGHIVSSDKEYILNMKDEQGNTILHLAASRKQYEVVDLLLDEKFGFKGKLEVNSVNKKGLTPLDVLASEGGDSDIEEMLRLSGAVRLQETPQNSVVEDPLVNNQLSGQEQTMSRPRRKSASRELQDYFKYDWAKGSPDKARNTLLVVAVLIMTATYQAVLSPPGGIWQEDFPPDSCNGNATIGVAYGLFLICNSFGFFMSLQVMYLLTYGFPLQFELRLALCALTVTYDTCMLAIAPSGVISKFFSILSIASPLLVGLLSKVRDCKKRRPRQVELQSTIESV